MKQYMAITFLGLVLLVCNVWYSVDSMAQTRTDRHAGPVAIAGSVTISGNTNLITNSTNPYIFVKDTTNSAQGQIRAYDSTVEIGTTSAHPLNLTTSGGIRLVIAADGTTAVFSNATDPLFRVEDTTNTVQVELKALDSTAEIGTESNHALSIVTNSTEWIGVSTAGALTLSGVSTVHSNATNPYIYVIDTTNSAQGQLRAYDTTVEVGSTSAHSLNLTTGGAIEMSITSAGLVGIGTVAPAVGLHGVTSDGALLWGNSEADDADKVILWGVEHYDVDEEPFYAFNAKTTTAGNSIWIGGNSSSGNAATTIQFYTAADNTTTTGTIKWTIDSDGDWDPQGTGAIDLGNAGQYIGDMNHKVLQDRGCIVAVDPTEAMGILRGVHNQDYDVRMPQQKHVDYGLRILDYSHFPGWIYDDGMYFDIATQELRQGDEGVDVGGLVSLLIAATKGLDKRIAGLEQLTTYQPTSLEGGQR